METTSLPPLETVSLQRDGHVLLIGLNRPIKRNAFNQAMLADLARAYALLESDTSVRAGVLFAHGDHFTGGLDLADVGPTIASGLQAYPPDDGRDPWRLDGTWTTPLVAVAHGWCMTLGIELLLAADIRIAATGTRFAQLEVLRGIYPFGGATFRLPRDAGWGNAMRWLLTGDEFDAAEAHRIGLVQEVADDAETALTRAREIAHTIADRAAPLGVRATWRPRTWLGNEVTRPPSSNCDRRSPRCSAPPTPPRACSRSSSAGRPASRDSNGVRFGAGLTGTPPNSRQGVGWRPAETDRSMWAQRVAPATARRWIPTRRVAHATTTRRRAK